MAKGFFGDSERHRAAGRKSSGNRTRGAQRRGGRQRTIVQEDETE